jgi:uroporphyrinogen decarboxylase
MRGIKEGYMDLYRRREKFEKLMELSLKIAVSFAKAQLEAGAHALWIGDVLASSRFIPEKHFIDLAFPYEKKLIDEIRNMGGISFIFHDEIKVNRFIQQSKVGADIVGIGNDTDLKEARIKLGDRWCLSGNIDPVKVLLQGSPVDVANAARKCIQDAGEKGGFILSTGECVARDTPPENIDAMVKTAIEQIK